MPASRTINAVILAAALLLFGGVSAALAAPLAWQSVDVTLHQDQETRILLVTGQLPPDARLPAAMELAVPAGSELVWIGEVLGGAPAEDPAVEHTVARRGNMDVYSFEMTKARQAQVEVDGSGAVASDGATHNASLSWTPSQDVPSVTMSVLLPQAAVVTRPSADATLQPGPAGAALYISSFTDVKAGQPLSLEFAYTAPSGGPPAGGQTGAAAPAGQSQGDTLLPLLLFAAFLAAALFVGRGVTRKLRAKSTTTDPPPDETDGQSDDADLVEPHTAEECAEFEPVPDGGHPGLSNRAKVGLAFGGVAVLLFATIGLVAKNASAPTDSGGAISKVFSAQAPCATAVIPLVLADGTDVPKAADRIFEILQSTGGLTTVTVYRDKPRLEVGYCESSTSEEAIRAALAPTGLLAATP